MRYGYSVTVDPDETITEGNISNNIFSVEPATRLWLSWYSIKSPWDKRGRVEYSLDAYIVSGGERRQIADWNIRQDIDWAGSCSWRSYCNKIFGFNPGNEYETRWFEIYGDEMLEIETTATIRRDQYTANVTYGPRSPGGTWGSGPTLNYECGYPTNDLGSHFVRFGDYLTTKFQICHEEIRP